MRFALGLRAVLGLQRQRQQNEACSSGLPVVVGFLGLISASGSVGGYFFGLWYSGGNKGFRTYIDKRSEYAAFRLSASVSSGSKRFRCVVRSISGFRL